MCAKLFINATSPSSVIEYTFEPVLVSPPRPPINIPLGITSETFSKKIASDINGSKSLATGPSLPNIKLNATSPASCCFNLPSSNVFNAALKGCLTTSYGLKYEKLIALPTPSFHLLIGIIAALESQGADKLRLYASICSIVTPVKFCPNADTPFSAPPSVTSAPINLL